MDSIANPSFKTHIQHLLKEIGDLIPRLENLNVSLASREGEQFQIYSQDDWAKHVFRGALRRILIFSQQNFLYIETVSLLALTRYLFELAVWVRLIAKDRRYGLVYYAQQVYIMKRFYTDQVKHFTNEATLFKDLSSRESEIMHQKLNRIRSLTDKGEQLAEARSLTKRVMEEIDWHAARHFSVYIDDAKTNGYGFQADIIETKIIPSANDVLIDLNSREMEFRQHVPQEILNLIPKNNDWKWRSMAGLVGMQAEYDFIYTYTSKLLHATPFSVTTDHPNLELLEVRTFLRFIVITIRDIIEIIGEQQL